LADKSCAKAAICKRIAARTTIFRILEKIKWITRRGLKELKNKSAYHSDKSISTRKIVVFLPENVSYAPNGLPV
jgi:hypothetical protein